MSDLPRPDDSFSAPIELGEPQQGIPDVWLEAYKEGNKLLPQMTGGLNIHVLAAVLEVPPPSWQSFSRSRLSDSQVRALGHEMTEVHRRRNIPHAFIGTELNREKSVDAKRVQQLWTNPRRRIVSSLTTYVSKCKEERGQYVRSQPEDDYPGELDRYFATSTGGADLASLKLAATSARDILRGKDVRQLAAEFRVNLLDAYVRNPGLKYDMEMYDARMQRINMIQDLVSRSLEGSGVSGPVRETVIGLI